ncbi:uncharacterized protein LOC143548372 [Bidens hawaiensis]|uniref:uncharacterized protein LOC143548372 n=1 Tax=Bidens hawaiensis TaxID=980011 RepID=UPI00404ABC64
MTLFAALFNRSCIKFKSLHQLASISSSSSLQSLDAAPDYIELRTGMQNSASSGHVNQSLQYFNFMSNNIPNKPSIYDYNAMLNCYLKSNTVGLNGIFALQMEMIRLGLQPNLPTFNTLLKGLNIVGEFKVAFWVVLNMRKFGFVPSFHVLSMLFKGCLDSVEFVEAISVLELMLEFGYVPTEPKAILLVNWLSQRGMVNDAWLVFFKLLGKGCFGNFQSCYFYNPILWGLCKSDRVTEALGLFCFVTKKGLVHNVCSYTALVYGFSTKRLFRDAFRCLKIMEADSGCYPNVRTYTTIIKSLCDNGRVKVSLSLLGEMEKKGCVPDIVTYNIIIRALSTENMVDQLCNLYERLYEKGIPPDRYTATALSGLVKKGSLEGALNRIRDIVSSGVSIDAAVYNVYLHCLCYAREPDELLVLVRSMIRDGIEPNNITFNTILKCFCEEKTLDAAMKFFEWVDWPEKGPDLVSFNTILSKACKLGDSLTVQKVVDLMEHEGVKLNVVGFTCLMQYFGKVGNVSDCLKVFEHMVIDGPRPSVVTVNVLMVCLCKNGEVEAGCRVFNNLKTYGLWPDLRSYDILMRAARNRKKYFLVDDLSRKFSLESRSWIMNRV